MAKSGVTVKVTDVKRYRGTLAKFFGGDSPAYVKVGVFGAKGEEAHSAPESMTASGKGGAHLTMVELAEIHEFGLGNVPERSFIRAYYDANVERLKGMLLTLMTNAIKKAANTGNPITDADRRRVLSLLGMKMKGEIQERIAGGIEPALAQRTIDRKGSSVPLIDTGQLRNSIDFEVSLEGDRA